MEKYSGFTDIGTGIQPFLYPVKAIESPSWLIPFKGLFFLARLILLAIAAIMVLLLNYASHFLLLKPLIWSWNRAWNFLLCIYTYSRLNDSHNLSSIVRLVLLICGFHWIQSSETYLKKSRKDSTKQQEKSAKTRRATLLVANHSSYFDIIYLAFRYNPLFLKVALNGDVEPQTWIQALYECGAPVPEKLDNGVTLQTFLKSYRSYYCPIAILPEGTTSNGRGLLQFLPVFGNDELEEELKLIGLKYSWEHSVCPSFTTGTKLLHLMNILYYFNHNFHVRRLAKKDIIFYPELNGTTSHETKENISNEGIYGSQISNLLAATLRLRKISKTAKDKSDFLLYFNERQSKLTRHK